MILEITQINDFYKIKGSLTRKNLPIFMDTFQNIFDKIDALIISLEGLEGIDREGVKAIVNLHNESLTRQKKLSIIGSGCDALYNHFKGHDAA